MIHFYYPFRYGPSDSLELRYSLRSIDKFYGENAEITIIGDSPGWLKNARVIPAPKRMETRFASFFNVLQKMEIALQYMAENIDFVWMADDLYFLRAVDIEDLKTPRSRCDASINETWHKGTGAGRNWIDCMKNTLDIIKANGLPMYSYETHTPRVYNRDKAKNIITRFIPNPNDLNFERKIFMFASLYFNHYVTKPMLLPEDKGFKLTVLPHQDRMNVMEYTKHHKVMVINVWRHDIERILNGLYSNKSRFEVRTIAVCSRSLQSQWAVKTTPLSRPLDEKG